MAEPSWDTIIVGQGLAGTTLAWQLTEAGQRVLVIDANERVTSSKIAAGLITPITGKRLVLSWNYDQFFPAAQTFYQRVEQLTGQKFFHERIALRLFKSDAEQSDWSVRSQKPEYRRHLAKSFLNLTDDPVFCTGTIGGFAMDAAQLDVAAYLEASRAVLHCEESVLDWERDVLLGKKGVVVKGHRARYLISCEGYAAACNPHFGWVPFLAAKGDILTVRFHSPIPQFNLHCGVWVAPTADPEIFRVGSTYDWKTLDQVPSLAARRKIENKLEEFIRIPYTVMDHQAAVRPIISESKATIGLHRDHDCLGFLNGLGSKGALLAPWYAKCFADFLVHQTPLPEWADLRIRFG